MITFILTIVILTATFVSRLAVSLTPIPIHVISIVIFAIQRDLSNMFIAINAISTVIYVYLHALQMDIFSITNVIPLVTRVALPEAFRTITEHIPTTMMQLLLQTELKVVIVLFEMRRKPSPQLEPNW